MKPTTSDTQRLFLYTKIHFKVNTHRNAFTNTFVRLCINSIETLVDFESVLIPLLIMQGVISVHKRASLVSVPLVLLTLPFNHF